MINRRVAILACLVLGLSVYLLPGRASATCYADKECPGGYIYCSGNYSCLVGSNSISCDGVETRCPLFCQEGVPACDNPAYVCFQYCKAHRPPGYTLTGTGCDDYFCCVCNYV
jgi:hypothetical protein